MFDSATKGNSRRPRRRPALPRKPEEARIALRCNRKELELLDSFVASDEYPSRSELMRAALHAFLRSRALSTAPTPRVDAEGLTEVPVRLRPDEIATWEAYARSIANRRPLADLFAEAVRQHGNTLKVAELVRFAQEQVREAVETQTQVHAMGEKAKDLERKGWIGR